MKKTLQTFGVLAALAIVTGCERETAASAQEGAPRAERSSQTELHVSVDGSGYHPASVSAAAGTPVRLHMTRASDEGCGQQVVFPSLNIRRDLPLNQPVAIDFTMPASGAVAFTCGMDMLRGSVVAQ